MTRQGGLGDAFFIGGYDLSGDVGSLQKISATVATLDVTGINKSAHERIPALRDGAIDFNSFFDTAAGASHPVLSALPTADTHAMYCRGTGVGRDAACLVAKQANYDPTRGADGALTVAVGTLGNAFALEWAIQLTAGAYTATNALTGQNAGFEGGIGNWVAVTNNTSTSTAAQHHTGANALSMSSTAGGDMTSASCVAGSIAAQGFPVAPGNQVLVQAWVRSAVSVRTCSVGVDWYTSGGGFISTTYGSGVADSTSAWTLVTGTVTAPATAAYGRVNVKVAATGAGAEVHYVDDAAYFLLPASYDTGASLAFGAQAYLQVTAFTGTDATIKIQDSADNVTFADVTSLTFGSVTAAQTVKRIAIGNTATVRRYVAVTVTTAAGLTALAFAVALNKNPVAGVVF